MELKQLIKKRKMKTFIKQRTPSRKSKQHHWVRVVKKSTNKRWKHFLPTSGLPNPLSVAAVEFSLRQPRPRPNVPTTIFVPFFELDWDHCDSLSKWNNSLINNSTSVPGNEQNCQALQWAQHFRIFIFCLSFHFFFENRIFQLNLPFLAANPLYQTFFNMSTNLE